MTQDFLADVVDSHSSIEILLLCQKYEKIIQKSFDGKWI